LKGLLAACGEISWKKRRLKGSAIVAMDLLGFMLTSGEFACNVWAFEISMG
jgi:hypothetical protein